MKVDKGNMAMNILFGLFMTVSIANLGFSIYLKSKKSTPKKKCNCGG